MSDKINLVLSKQQLSAMKMAQSQIVWIKAYRVSISHNVFWLWVLHWETFPGSFFVGACVEPQQREGWDVQPLSLGSCEAMCLCGGGGEGSRRHSNSNQEHRAGPFWPVGQTRSSRGRWGEMIKEDIIQVYFGDNVVIFECALLLLSSCGSLQAKLAGAGWRVDEGGCGVHRQQGRSNDRVWWCHSLWGQCIIVLWDQPDQITEACHCLHLKDAWKKWLWISFPGGAVCRARWGYKWDKTCSQREDHCVQIPW